MKQFLATLLVALMIISTFLPVLADQPEISLHLFGEKVESDVAPVIINDRTLVPARALFEAMGAQVIWNGIKKQVHISRENISILLTLNSTTVQVNGEKKTLDVPAQLVNDRTLVPVRFVSETLDFDVRWDQPTRTVYIDRKEPELATFDKITAKSVKNGNQLHLSVTPYIKPNISTLPDPYRIILDFKQADGGQADDSISVKSDQITQVRWAQHGEDFRIVIECPQKLSYQLTKTGGGSFSITVGETKKTDEKTESEKENITDNESEKEEKEIPITPTHLMSIKNRLVVIDAGHGGKDPGAIAHNGDSKYLVDEDGNYILQEKDVTLAIALKVRDYLEDEDINVMLTREKDEFLELTEIGDIANKAKADLFVSIHCNSFESSTPKGVEILAHDTNGKLCYGIQSKQIAKNIMKEYTEATDMFDRGVKDGSWLAVLKRTQMPGVLIETGFITNPDDRAILMNKKMQGKIAAAIAEGIITSLEQMPENKTEFETWKKKLDNAK
ncbi:MAG: AMIN domain-containing protein [Ruminococcaceae bacterium]|nr:AMIN domain-containing protein [Oscillospiraceae bacterium]